MAHHGLPGDLREAVDAEVHSWWVVFAERALTLVRVGGTAGAVDEHGTRVGDHEATRRLGIRLEDLPPVRRHLVSEVGRCMEDVGDPFGELTEVHRRQVTHDRSYPRLGEPPPIADAATACEPEDLVVDGERAGERETHTTRCARDEDPPPTLRLRRPCLRPAPPRTSLNGRDYDSGQRMPAGRGRSVTPSRGVGQPVAMGGDVGHARRGGAAATVLSAAGPWIWKITMPMREMSRR